MDVVTYALSRKYTDKSIEGIAGTLAGKNCTIASIEQVEGGNLITFEWYSDEGESQTSTMFVQDGVLGEDAIAPTYDPTQTYNEGALVVYENELYELGAATTTGDFDPTVWDLTNIDELLATKANSSDLTAGNTSYDNTTSGLEADDVQEAIDEVVTDIESVETALATKAEVDGFYDELYAGNLLSDNTETDNTPYTYRPSPSGKSYVDLSVVGGTVAWNQLVQNGNFSNGSASWSGIGMVTDGVAITNYSQAFVASYQDNVELQTNHIYIGSIKYKGDADTKSSGWYLTLGNIDTSAYVPIVLSAPTQSW